MQEESAVRSLGWLAFGLAGAIALLGAWLLFGPLGPLGHRGATPRLDQASSNQLSDLSYTLDPARVQSMEQQAKACTVPLATVSVWHDAGVVDEPVHIQSGSYISPSFMLTGTPQPVIIPYPAPYDSGAGMLKVLGNDKGVELALSPVTGFANIAVVAAVIVTWDTESPCS